MTQLEKENIELIKLYATVIGLRFDATGVERHIEGLGVFDDSGMVRMLEFLGFDANTKAVKIKKIKEERLPLLAKQIDGRLMIVGRIDGAKALIQSAGEESAKEVDVSYLDEVLSGEIFETKKADKNTSENSKFGIGWFINSIKKYRFIMGEILLASFFVQIFALLTPLIFQVIIDKVLTHRTLSTLDVMAIALLGVSLFEVVLSAMRHYIFSHTTNRIDAELGSKLFSHLLRLPLSYFESRRSGDTVARVKELENARNFLTGSALTSWLDLFFALVFLAVMFYYSPMLTMIVVASLPVFFGASWIVTPLLRKKLEDKFALGAENQAFLVETVTAMETLKTQAVETRWQKEWENRMREYIDSAFHASHVAGITNQFINLASKLLTVLLLWFGAKLVIDGDLTVGGLIAFNMLAGRINAPILKLSSLWQDFTQMKVSISRLADIMDAPTETYFGADRTTPPAIEGRITFEHVTFKYRADGSEILSDISFDVKAGQIIGLVGVSGAGKTTIMRLIQRLYTPEKGRILIDGMDINLVDVAWLRRQIGVVGQDTVLFNRSVRENIAFSNPDTAIEKVMEAAKLAGAHEFILELPEGYDTVIGERGSKLSGGQRARIAIARALVGNPKILLLDEATASLDYESEFAIHDNMTGICDGRTVVIAAHRLSTLRLTDRIIVIEKGRLTEDGHHTELAEGSGKYQMLYQAHQVLESANRPIKQLKDAVDE